MSQAETIQDYDEIFTDDKLNIKSNVVDFAQLIEQDVYKENTTSKVYSLSAEFGIGKTFFCDKLQRVLEKDKVKVGKLNIWEMDFYENPLVPILAELNKLYSSKGKKLPSKIIDMALNLGNKALSTMTETGINWGYRYAIAQIAQAQGCEHIAEGLANVDVLGICKDKLVSETIYDDYKQYQNAFMELKDSLTKWSSRQKGKPIVIIIDELDRCRPDYAVKTLEVLKHIFDIPGFVFILAIDEEQLKNSVQTLFGKIDYEGYKRKFINNSFILPQPDRLAFTEYLYEKSGIRDYIDQIQKDKRELVFRVNIPNIYICTYYYSEPGSESKRQIAQNFNYTQTSENIIKRYFAAYSECLGFSLRKMEQVFDRLVLFIKQINVSKELFSPDLMTFLICIHEFDMKLYNKVISIQGNVITSCSQSQNLLSFIMRNTQNEKTEKMRNFNRDMTPELLSINGYSSYRQRDVIGNMRQEPIIKDNVDRFFIENTNKLVMDAVECGEIKLENIDLKTLKENYCKHIDFISHFE